MRIYKSNSELDICITQFNVFIEFVNLVELRQHRLILSLLTSKQQRSHHKEFNTNVSNDNKKYTKFNVRKELKLSTEPFLLSTINMSLSL